jgi:hypothetical protein
MGGIVGHAPNTTQRVPLSRIVPSRANVRLFVERESLESMEAKYRAYLTDVDTVLPDPPVVRFRSLQEPLELLAGHRRLTAATNVGLKYLPCRVVEMTDEEAYRFIREANNYETLTTVEKAFAVAEMDRLGFTGDDIRETMGNIGLPRYLAIGRVVNPDWFSDLEKKCDPSITLWGYALHHGEPHFRYCFKQWDSGLWDEDDCHREFKRVGKASPPESYQQGVLMSVDKTGTILRLRGTLDMARQSLDDMEDMMGAFMAELKDLLLDASITGSFGPKRVTRFLAETFEEES